MALVSMRQLLDHAAENGYGVPAFNVNNLEQVQAIMAAASEVGAPVIMQASAGARKYAGEHFLRHLISAAVEAYPDIPVCMHQDHGQSPSVCQGAIRMGFTSVMMDGSLMADGKTISTYDYNVEVTRRVVEMSHCIGVSVEGELGCLGSLETMKGDKEDGHGTDAVMTREQLLTDPDQAADFVKATQLDALAIAIGTSHGAYKFTRKPTGETLSIQRVKEIHERLPNTHLVMHGSSSVPQEYLATIRQFGGDMRETYGVPVEEIQEAIKHGVRKVNIDTDIRLAMTAATRQYLFENPSKFDPRDFLKVARKASTYWVKSKSYTDSLKSRAQIYAYALATSEENASGGIVVTAPTCGSCGVVPAVLYHLANSRDFLRIRILRALATAGLFGNVAKTNASISGAEVGCQGEVGVACAMAAAAACQLFGGTPSQIEYAAEMGLEHHLGLTCDPVCGLVQVPCIERNAIAAARAFDANAYATLSDGSHMVSFDKVVEVMNETGHALPSLYRETSEGGLAKRFKR